MRFFQRPRTLKNELQILFLAVGSAFLVLATVLLYQNGQASLRRQLAASAPPAPAAAARPVPRPGHRPPVSERPGLPPPAARRQRLLGRGDRSRPDQPRRSPLGAHAF